MSTDDNEISRQSACPGHRFVNGRCQRCPMTLDEFNAANPPADTTTTAASSIASLPETPVPVSRTCADCGEPLVVQCPNSRVALYNHAAPSKCLHVESERDGVRRSISHAEITAARSRATP